MNKKARYNLSVLRETVADVERYAACRAAAHRIRTETISPAMMECFLERAGLSLEDLFAEMREPIASLFDAEADTLQRGIPPSLEVRLSDVEESADRQDPEHGDRRDS